jgi:hypothetical protein
MEGGGSSSRRLWVPRVENKRLGPVLAYIAERQRDLDMNRRTRRRIGGLAEELVRGGLQPLSRHGPEPGRTKQPIVLA